MPMKPLTSDPSNFAHVGDPKKPFTWTMPLTDERSVAAAIVALSKNSSAGSKAAIPPAAVKTAIARIRAAIEKLPMADFRRKQLMDQVTALRLD